MFRYNILDFCLYMVIMKVPYLSIPSLLSRLAGVALVIYARFLVICGRARSQYLMCEIRNQRDAADEGDPGSSVPVRWIGPASHFDSTGE